MNEHRLLHALGDVDDELVADAGRHTTPLRFLRYGAAAAAFVLLAVGVTLLPWGGDNISLTDGPVSTDTGEDRTEEGSLILTPGNTTAAAVDSDELTHAPAADATTVGHGNTVKANTTTKINAAQGVVDGVTLPTYVKDPELALIPKWEDKTIRQKYPEIPFEDITYSVYYPIDPKDVGKKLGTVTAQGQDVYTDTFHTTTVTLYRLADIAPHCAVAVKYADEAGYYSAVQTWYQPETLGEFLEGLQLKKYGKFGTASWDYFDEVYHYRTYTGVSAAAVFALLLDDPTLQNIYEDGQSFWNMSINISVDLPILGLENPVVMMLSEDGYLFTNILGCGKAFYIGTARVEAFKKYLQENCACTV